MPEDAALPHPNGPGAAITRWLERSSLPAFSTYATATAFATYFCMYAFRRPFAVGTYAASVDLGPLGAVDLKIFFVISQVLGYCGSKFIGIKVVSELDHSRRAVAILACIAVAEIALLLFAVVPSPYCAACLFLNGLPLGMIWGLVFGFLEGRRVSEALGAGLSASYIIASGAVKTVGKWVLDAGVPEYWMPFVTGLMFLPLLVICVYLLSRLPPPTREDIAARVERVPMNSAARWAFARRFAPGLIALTVIYFFLTAYRDYRDNFAREIWDALGYSNTPAIMTTAELPIAVGVLLALAALMGIRNNRTALIAVHFVMLAGPALIGVSTVGYQAGMIGPATWMTLVGLGLYIAYVPYGCILFDRMIAALGVVATAGFLIYVTDAFGYLGSVVVLLYKNFAQAHLSRLEFFVQFSYLTSLVCGAGFLISVLYFGPAARAAAGHADVPLPEPAFPARADDAGR